MICGNKKKSEHRNVPFIPWSQPEKANRRVLYASTAQDGSRKNITMRKKGKRLTTETVEGTYWRELDGPFGNEEKAVKTYVLVS